MKKQLTRTNPALVPGYELTNAFFNSSQLKERIRMLKQAPTRKRAVWQYALIAPVIALPMLYLAACDDQGKALVKDKTTPQVVERRMPVLAEPTLVEGKVVGPDGKPLPGAAIVIAAGTTGTTTDMDGNYKLLMPKGATGVIIASFIGFGDQQATVEKAGTIIFKLDKAANKGTVTKAEALKRNETVIEQRMSLNEKDVYTVVQNQPMFPGGMPALTDYINTNLVYPEAAKRAGVSGKVFISFVVDKTGKISNIMVLKGLGFGCDEAALRLLAKMPDWKPGSQDGKAVSVRYNLPINFALTK